MTASKTLALLSAALAWLATPAFAITGTSWVDDFEHPYVGLVVFYDAAGEFAGRCSGSADQPDEVPDGRALRRAGADSARVYFQQGAGANFDPVTRDRSGDRVIRSTCAGGDVGRDVRDGEHARAAAQLRLSRAGCPNTRDVGLVILDQAMHLPAGCVGSACEFGQLPTAGALDALATSRGRQGKRYSRSAGTGVSSRPASEHSAVPSGLVPRTADGVVDAGEL